MMSHYLVAQIDIVDRDEYSKYEAGFLDIFSKYEGKMLAVDEQPNLLEGNWPFTRTVLVEFPSSEAALDWYQSDEYQNLAKHRFASSSANIVMLKSLDLPL
ncbi:MAG: DUF1330 domain-containing protein [bacterium]